MRVAALLGLVAVLVACGDTIAPVAPRFTARINGPDTVPPNTVVTLTGVANHATNGVLNDSLLQWFVNDSTATTGARLVLSLGDTGTIVVRLVARLDGDSAGAVHTVSVMTPGTAMWTVAAGLTGQYPFDIAVDRQGRAYVGSLFRRLAIDPVPGLAWYRALSSTSGGQDFAVRPDGTVLQNTNRLALTTRDGDSLWTATTNTVYYFGLLADGSVRAVGPRWVYALNAAGTLQWADSSFQFGEMREIAIDALSRTYVTRASRRLVVYAATGTVLADVSLALPAACREPGSVVPVAEGEVLVLSGPFSFTTTCMSRVAWPSGTVRWTWDPDDVTTVGTPAVAADGAAYVTVASGRVIKIDQGGTTVWESATTGACADSVGTGTPALGRDGTIFTHTGGTVTAVGPDGTVRWVRTVPGAEGETGCETTPPTLAHDGRLLVARWGFAISALAAGTRPDTTAIWGQHLASPEHHRRARLP